MAGNGLLMKALMTVRQKLANNVIDYKEYKDVLKFSKFGNEILHWNKPNPFTENYAQFVDYVDNPKFLIKQMKIFPKEESTASKIASTIHRNPIFMLFLCPFSDSTF